MPTRQKIDGKEWKLRAEAVEYGFASVRMEGLGVRIIQAFILA
jgi:hypothetical protein